MNTIEKNNALYEVEIETTKEYYKKHSRIADIRMRNFEKHLPDASPLLAEYLDEFGVDIKYPDELCWCWKDENDMLHYNVAYTIVGRVVRAERYEVVMQDKSRVHIVLETEYVPNEQTEPYFAFTIYNLEMPWSMDVPYPETEKRYKEGFFEKIAKKLKKDWTKTNK